MNFQIRYRREARSVYSENGPMIRCIAAIGLIMLAGGCSPLPSRVQPRVMATLPSYSEGIAFDAEGAAFVSVLNRESVFIIQELRPPALWHHAIEPNGHKVLQDGTHLVAARGGVRHVDPNGGLIEVMAPQLVTPNDLALDGDGGVYITVPEPSEADRGARRSGVYYLDSARTVHRVAEDFCYPNGIAVRPDGKSLVVNDSCNRRVYEFQIQSPGALAGRRVFAEVSDSASVPDGMTFDQEGRLYMADYGRGVIVVFDPSGQVIREYATGLQHASNVAFGGDRLTDLYVTGSQGSEDGSGRLVILPIGVKGRSNSAMSASLRDR